MDNTPAKYISSKTNKFLAPLVYSNLWISIGSVLLCYQVFILNGLEANFNYLYFILFSTLFSYSIQRLFRIKKLEKTTPQSWVVKNKNIAITITVIALIFALYFFLQFISLTLLYWLVPTGVISLLYSYSKLRDVPYIKIILISASWGITAGVIPLVINNHFDVYLISMNFAIVFLYITAITIPFDIRDLELDEYSKKTIPQLFGIKKSKLIAVAFQVISLILFTSVFQTQFVIAYFISSIIASLLIILSNRKKSDLYFSFRIDGHIIFQFLLIFFLH